MSCLCVLIAPQLYCAREYMGINMKRVLDSVEHDQNIIKIVYFRFNIEYDMDDYSEIWYERIIASHYRSRVYSHGNHCKSGLFRARS